MRAVITIADLPHNKDKIGFSVRYQRDSNDSGITHARYLTHQLTETLQRIAVRTDQLDAQTAKEPEDRLIDSEAVSWLVWFQIQPGRTDFPAPAQRNPHRWSRQAVMQWMRTHQGHRIDFDLAQAFIRRPYLKGAQ